MNKLQERMNQIVRGIGLKPKTIAELAGFNESSLYRCLDGTRSISHGTLMKLAKKFPDHFTNSVTSELLVLAEMYKGRSGEASGWGMVAERASASAHQENIVAEPPAEYSAVLVPEATVQIKVYKSVRAGHGEHGCEIHYDEEYDSMPFPLHYLKTGAFGLLVEGESMAAPPSNIYPGSYAVFEPCDDCKINGRVCCVCVEGWAVCAMKRLQIEPDGTLLLTSDNKAFPPIRVNPREQQVKVLGVLRGCWLPADGKRVTGPYVK